MDNEQPKYIAEQFDFYLSKMGLKQSEMSDVQYIETRRSFYAGFGQMAAFFISRISDLSVDEGANEVGKIINEVADFFVKEENF